MAFRNVALDDETIALIEQAKITFKAANPLFKDDKLSRNYIIKRALRYYIK